MQDSQKFRKTPARWGKLSSKTFSNDDMLPSYTVCVDCVGPVTIPGVSIKGQKGNAVLRAMTMLDPATFWFEVCAVDTFSAEETAKAFDTTWLCRYPRPVRCIHDNGNEFKGEFLTLLSDYGIKSTPTTIRNPQANGFLERAHAQFHVAARAYEFPQVLDSARPFDEFLADVAFSLRCRYHSVAAYTPAQLTFGRDMLLPISFEVDWPEVKNRRQAATLRSLTAENKKRFARHEFKVGDRVYIVNDNERSPKYEKRKFGPYTIVEVRNNSTVVLEKRHGYLETVNIRRLVPVG